MMLRIKDALVRYGTVTALDHVSLDINEGEVVALLGASGSGKSSLLRAVAGLEPLTGGQILLDGQDISGVPTHKRGFGMMFQDGQLFPHLRVGGNVAYGVQHLTVDDRRERVLELLTLVGLPEYGPRRITELSGGEAQRIALARSLAPEPRLLLLDEPLSALDRSLREHLVGVLAAGLRETRTTAIYVTHDQDEAFAVADRVAVLGRGQLWQVDRPDVLWANPINQEVAEFLGYGPFIEAPLARQLGLETQAIVGLADDSLVPDTHGPALPVVERRFRRGGASTTVELPDGQLATVLTAHPINSERVGVRLSRGAELDVHR